LKTLTEASAESKLLVLLHKHQFKEALDLAVVHNLDPQPVYEQQVTCTFMLWVVSCFYCKVDGYDISIHNFMNLASLY